MLGGMDGAVLGGYARAGGGRPSGAEQPHPCALHGTGVPFERVRADMSGASLITPNFPRILSPLDPAEQEGQEEVSGSLEWRRRPTGRWQQHAQLAGGFVSAGGWRLGWERGGRVEAAMCRSWRRQCSSTAAQGSNARVPSGATSGAGASALAAARRERPDRWRGEAACRHADPCGA